MDLERAPVLLKRRRTKIVATLGPATADPVVVGRLVGAGVDVFRLNMAHGDRAGHRAMFASVREAADAAGAPVAVLADLAGPKIRVGRFDGGAVELREGEAITVTTRDVAGGPGLIPLGYERLGRDVEPGQRLLLDDGNLELVVDRVAGTDLACTVLAGGRLSDHKGVNFPETELSVSAPTDEDREDARFAVELGVDFLGMSFVRSADDVRELRRCIEAAGRHVPIVAKFEKPEALRQADEILEAADAIMVARGDLGVEMPLESVPAAQDELVERARIGHKPVIIATQMLESMIENPRPTRAEVSDVAHAVLSGTDAVMLSGETAVGRHPVASVQIMDRIIRRTEAGQWAESAFRTLTRDETGGVLRAGDAVSRAVSQLSRELGARAILVVSRSGTSAAIASAARPAAPLLAATPDARTQRRMNLLWGVVPIHVVPGEADDPVPLFRRLVAHLGLGEAGDCGLIVRGFHEDPAVNQPSITVVTV